jgi:hypothetical protein
MRDAVTENKHNKSFSLYQIRIATFPPVVVKALRYKPAGRGFDSRWCHWNVSVI